jgi:hypothetical protein
MILYYALGGGLGHLTRGRRVLETLGLTAQAAFVTASPYAKDPRVTGGIPVIDVPKELEHTPAAHHTWIRGILREHRTERLLVDTFPGGIQGELCGLDIEMDLVARILRWDEYRRVVPGELPTFDTTWLAEDAEVRTTTRRTVPLDLAPAPSPAIESDDYWLIVHSGPEDEVRELVAYAAELRTLAHNPAPVRVATRTPIPLPPGFALIDEYPASRLYPAAARIITAAGFNTILETAPWRSKHHAVPFARRFDDQYLRAARARTSKA